MTVSDTELIARVLASDDRGAFGELVLRHQSGVRSFLRHLTGGDQAQADDLAQDTFIQAYRGLARYRGNSSFTTWLLGIANNHHRNARRRDWARQPEPLDDRAADESDPHTRTVELRQDLDAALLKLTGDERIALHLFYQQGLSQSEITAVTGWPLGTVKTRLLRSKDRLRELLAAWKPQT